ncbi:MAG TPA: Rpn family recombination-promoting nuclease/putative transposase, partial [Candidatus Babeliaceae bacterium]|nr:Rpn family recombination-promoting nuclease/putative transposase [Candidatus Babeliaceae bacterium]
MKTLDRYIDPFTDFGFKRLFGSESNKELLTDFLNQLLKGKKLITRLTYAKNEHAGLTAEKRKAVFDLYCRNENGERFIIELQKVKQQYFRDRSLYYATFPIQEQAPAGENWDYRQEEIYTIGIMDFTFHDTEDNAFLHEVKLMNTRTKTVFYDKLTFLYVEMPKFNKTAEELKSGSDKWLYLLKHLRTFREIPLILQERIFKKVFTVAETSKLNQKDMDAYIASMKDKWDWNNALDYAKKEAAREGAKEGIREGIRKGIQKGIREGIQKGMQEGVRKGERQGQRKKSLEIARKMKKENIPTELIRK